MKRAFISLYLLLVSSVIGLGLGLNHFWERLAPEPAISQDVRSLFVLLESQTLTLEVKQQLAQQGLVVQRLLLDELGGTQVVAELQRGAIVSTRDHQHLYYYKLLDAQQLLMLSQTLPSAGNSLGYSLLLWLFYLGLALAVLVWLWPLSRDAQRLEQQIHRLGQEGLSQGLQLRQRSPLYPLVQAFNQMAQRLRELLASHRDMTNAVSHELRTPLARMKFALAMLEEDRQLTASAQRQLHGLAQDVVEMESLINSLLTYAGFERHSQQLQTRQGRMGDMLEELQLRFARNNPRQLQLQLQLPAVEVLCECEWKLMETAVANALSNAARYAHKRICIRWKIEPARYVLQIEDDGPGIPAAQRERVFASFVRLTPNAEHETQGFGLGLAIIQRIVHWHSGDARFVAEGPLGGANLEISWPKKPF